MSEYGRNIEEQLKRRTREFALAIMSAAKGTHRDIVVDILIRQLIRSSTSVGANYRSACRAKSKADMVAKLAIVEEELDESIYWLDLLQESRALPTEIVQDLTTEGENILRIIVASIRTLRQGISQPLRVSECPSDYLSDDRDLLLELAPETPNPRP